MLPISRFALFRPEYPERTTLTKMENPFGLPNEREPHTRSHFFRWDPALVSKGAEKVPCDAR